jgi:hypothetical protein
MADVAITKRRFTWPGQKECERKRIKKIRPQVVALYAKNETLLASDRIMFDIPIHERLQTSSREFETWIRQITPTVKECAFADADTYIRTTNHTIDTFMIPRRDPLTLNEHVNEL